MTPGRAGGELMTLFRKYLEFPLAGLIFAATTGFVLLAAVNSGTNLLFVCFGVMLGCLLLSILVPGLMLRRLEITRRVVDHAAAGERIDVHYEIHNARRFWPSFALAIRETAAGDRLLQAPEGYCLHLPAGQTQTVMAHMIARRRGVLQLSELQSSCAFPFGFLNRLRYRLAPQKVIIYPRMGTLSRQVLLRARESATLGTISSPLRGGQDEFYGLREYRDGDPVRAIHWKRSARTGDLVIRELTSNVTPQLIAVLDLRGASQVADGVARAEQGIELAAAVIAHALMENFAVGLLVAGMDRIGLGEPRMGRDQQQRLLGVLGTLELSDIKAEPLALPRKLRKLGAQWVVISLTEHARSELPNGASVTLLPLDDPQSSQWLTFPELARPETAPEAALAVAP